MTTPNPTAAATDLPVIIVGAGPIGLAAAAHVLERGLTPLVIEASDQIAASIRAGATPGSFRRGTTTSMMPHAACWKQLLGSHPTRIPCPPG
jgi:2-polyprenyl-6-methoxyphenol hydroxylase-like FAD-dependent oxidoreductase